MPRILIADDNSNIQRMAALALKDAGIEVIAVGNGEAAVRKMPEVLPDLVLADIFMPVRNGYEVCEFIKHDPRYANIPVLLLAGAFDPFDEQEAQRVHADGVLKKPFVPPDPLINAVRTLLAKSAGDRLMSVTVPVAAEASAESGRSAGAALRVLEPPAVQPSHEAPEEFALPLGRDNLGTIEKGATFAPAMESMVAETDEAESVVTASRDPILGEPAFWVPSEEPAETEEAASQDEDLTDHSWNSEGRTVPLRDDPPTIEKPAAAPAGLLHDDLVVSGSVPEDLELDSMAPPAADNPAAASGSPSSKDRSSEDTLPLPEAWVDSAPLELEPLDASPANESAASPLSAASQSPLPPSAALVPSAPLASAAPPSPAASVAAPSESESEPVEDAVPTLELAETLPAWAAPQKTHKEPEPAAPEQAAKPEPEAELPAPVAKPEPAAHQERESAPEAPKTEREAALGIQWPPAFIPAISSAVNDAFTSALQVAPAARSTTETSEPRPPSEASTASSASQAGVSPNPEAMEAAIQRVMERMQPQIVEMVTRDILRPLVEALVQQELKK